jgi:hypothetical protein
MQPLLQWKSNEYYTIWLCVCSPSYPAYNVHAPYHHVTSLAPQYISTLSLINSTILEKKLLNRKCMFWFSLQVLSETFLILRRNEHDMINLHVKYSLFLSGFNETWIFSTDFWKILKQSKLLHADRWTNGQTWWS